MGQLGDLAKKVGKEKDAGTTVKIGEGIGETPAERDARLRREAIAKEEARVKSIADAKAKAEASTKGLARAAGRK